MPPIAYIHHHHQHHLSSSTGTMHGPVEFDCGLINKSHIHRNPEHGRGFIIILFCWCSYVAPDSEFLPACLPGEPPNELRLVFINQKFLATPRAQAKAI